MASYSLMYTSAPGGMVRIETDVRKGRPQFHKQRVTGNVFFCLSRQSESGHILVFINQPANFRQELLTRPPHLAVAMQEPS